MVSVFSRRYIFIVYYGNDRSPRFLIETGDYANSLQILEIDSFRSHGRWPENSTYKNIYVIPEQYVNACCRLHIRIYCGELGILAHTIEHKSINVLSAWPTNTSWIYWSNLDIQAANRVLNHSDITIWIRYDWGCRFVHYLSPGETIPRKNIVCRKKTSNISIYNEPVSNC